MVTKRFRTTRRQITRRSQKYRMRGGATKAQIDIFINDEKLDTSNVDSNGYDWEHLREVIGNRLVKHREIKDSNWVILTTDEDGYYNGLSVDSGTEEMMLYGKLNVDVALTTYDDDGDIYLNWPLTGLEYLLLDEQKNPKKLTFTLYSN